MPTRGYNSYHGRRSLWKILLALLLVLLLTAAGAFLLLQDYIVYESDGSIRLELPLFHREPGEPPGGGTVDVPPVVILPGDSEIGGQREPEEPEPPAPLNALILSAAALCSEGTETVPEDCNGLVVELKGDNGSFLYTSQQALDKSLAPGAVTQSQLTAALAEEERTAVARIACFHDSAFASSDMAGAGVCQPNGYIWYDYQNSHWLDPAKQAARDYLFAVAGEAEAMGFGELLLADFHYPVRGKLYKIDYSKMTVSKEEALCAFLTELRAALGEDTLLSIEMDPAILLAGGSADAGLNLSQLLPLVDHIYLAAAEGDRPAILEALRTAGAAEPESVAVWRQGDAWVSAAAANPEPAA